MKIITILFTLSLALSAHARYYFCSSANNPYDEYKKETDMVLVSKCFRSNDTIKLINKVCQSDYKMFFPRANENFVKEMVTAESFTSLASCKEREQEALFFAEEPYGEGFVTKTFESRTYFLINTY